LFGLSALPGQESATQNAATVIENESFFNMAFLAVELFAI
jgi:hypothetical protein